jgi:DNA repair exonuclease SbcCD nuclease subunit
MGLKILHTADWHLDSPFGGFTEAQRILLRNEQRKLPGKIADLCRREDCDMMLIAGDIFDAEPTRETIRLLKKALSECGVPVLISPGNHDFCHPDSIWVQERWPENVFVFSGALESVSIRGLDCRIYGGAFRGMDCGPMLENFRAEGNETYKIAVLHGDPTQVNSPYNPVTVAQVRASGLQYLALGHIHKAGAFQAGRTLCAWPGCPMGRGWDETGDKGVCIVTLTDVADIQAVGLDTLRFHDLSVDIGEDALTAMEMTLPASGGKDFYRVSLTGYGDVEPEELKKAFPQFPNLELRDKTEPPLNIWADADEDSLEGIYFAMLKKAMEERPEEAEQIRLAAEISRKLLSGKEVVL